MQIQHSSDTCKILGKLHGGAALSECILATCQSYVESNRYLILEKRSLRNEPILDINEVFYVFQLAVPYSYFIQKSIFLLRIDNSGWSVNSSTLFDVAGMSCCQRKYHVLYIIRQPIINSIY